MKTIDFMASLFCVTLLIGCAGDQEAVQNASSSQAAVRSNPREGKNSNGPDSTTTSVKIVDQIVEAACGQCQLGMEGKGCDLAIRVDGNSYFVDGSSIDGHGDAHGEGGLCNCIRKAKVVGEIKDGRFVASSLVVLPIEE